MVSRKAPAHAGRPGLPVSTRLRTWWYGLKDIKLNLQEDFWRILPHRHQPYCVPNATRLNCARCGRWP